MEEGKKRNPKRKHIRDQATIDIIAANVVSFRKKANISQRQLAFESGLTNAQVGTIETAKGNPTASQLAAIAKVLGVQTYELLKFDDNN